MRGRELLISRQEQGDFNLQSADLRPAFKNEGFDLLRQWELEMLGP